MSEPVNTDSEDRLESVLREIWPEVSAYARRRLPGDRQQAEDITQDAAAHLINRWRARGEMSPTMAVTIMKNSIKLDVIDLWRKQDRRRTELVAVDDQVLLDHLDQNPNPEQEVLALLARIDTERRVSELLALLDEQQRMAIVAVYIDGASQKQAAADIGITVRAVQMRLAKALTVLRRHLDTSTDITDQQIRGKLP